MTPVPILLYHSISDTATTRFRRWTVSPSLFAAHMAFLAGRQYTSLTVSQFAEGPLHSHLAPPAKPVVITFDDGFADFYTNALPRLNSAGLVATLYIVTGYVGATSRWLAPEGESDRRMLSWSQIREIEQSGIECGAHGHLHLQMDVLPKAGAWKEIDRSKRELEQHLGHSIRTFAYPHGYSSPPVRRMIEQAGFTSASGVKHAMSSASDNRFNLARIIVSADTSVSRLAAMLRGEGLAISPGESVQTVGWRFIRRSMYRMRSSRVSEPAILGK